ncbi:10426_t:CDS:2, partial [Gigaspora rosea]
RKQEITNTTESFTTSTNQFPAESFTTAIYTRMKMKVSRHQPESNRFSIKDIISMKQGYTAESFTTSTGIT